MIANSTPFPQPISEQIWEMKYRLQTPNPEIPNDVVVEDTWTRLANACATDPTTGKVDYEKRDRFYASLEDFKWLPAGRITAGAGSGRNVTLFNCYVMGTIPDSLSGIFDMLKEAAMTMQQGGGIGYDFSTIRPKGSPVKKVDADASGPLTFMDVWDVMCKTIMSAGNRRGAMMATMDCSHPDIEEFIEAKQDKLRLRNFNVSVLVSDAFMEAVEKGLEWPLTHKVAPQVSVDWLTRPEDHPLSKVESLTPYKLGEDYIYKVVDARSLWEKIIRATYDYAEPGVLFIDRINKQNNLWYMEDIRATNPCGEQPLPPYGACLLGSINLAKLVRNPFELGACLDGELLEETVKTAVRMLDSVIDVSLFPLEEQRKEALKKRRMGIGVTGVADMLFMMQYAYGTQHAARWLEEVMERIALTAYRESIQLAKEFGPCPATRLKKNREAFVQSGFMQKMPEDIIEGVLEHGIRNALLLSIAPTGTISMYAGNVSSGIEPIFAPSYQRKVTQKDGTKTEETVSVYSVHLFNQLDWDQETKDAYWDKYMRTAQDLLPQDHLVMQAAAQKWVDSSISKTINCPEDISFEDFQEVYEQAFKLGCKGCTTYRPNDVTGSVLSVEPEKPATAEPEAPEAQTQTQPVTDLTMERPYEMDGTVYKLRWEGDAVYVTFTNLDSEDGSLAPFEMFITTKNPEHAAWMSALTRMVSAVFRRGGDVSFVVDELKNVFDPKGGQWVNGKYVPSLIALLGNTLEQHMMKIGYLPSSNLGKVADSLPEPGGDATQLGAKKAPMQCPSCKGFNVIKISGCPTCQDCGYSKCG